MKANLHCAACAMSSKVPACIGNRKKRTEKNVPPERVPSEVIEGLRDALARLELPLVEPNSAAAPADDTGFGEKLFAHAMVSVPVAGAFYGNQGAHAAQVAGEVARQPRGRC